MDIWEGTSLITKSYQELFFEAYAAVPSTMEMVERSVKKARLCQRTGKLERAVTASGIAGDGVSEACAANCVVSSNSVDMEWKRKKSLETAAAEGTTLRNTDKPKYELDIKRGPGITLNMYNHALEIFNNATIQREILGDEEFDRRKDTTIQMLTSLENNGWFGRHAQR
jgi:hypothetical protein